MRFPAAGLRWQIIRPARVAIGFKPILNDAWNGRGAADCVSDSSQSSQGRRFKRARWRSRSKSSRFTGRCGPRTVQSRSSASSRESSSRSKAALSKPVSAIFFTKTFADEAANGGVVARFDSRGEGANQSL